MDRIGYDIAHLIGALVLMASFALLSGRRITVMIRLLAVQGVLVAALAGWAAISPGHGELFITAGFTLILKGVVVPLALRYLLRRSPPPPYARPRLAGSMLAGLGLTILAILVILPQGADLPPLAREQLAVALSVVLMALLILCVRQELLAQVIGIFSLENGLILAAISAAGMPLVVEMSIALALLGILALAGLLGFSRIAGPEKGTP